MVEGGAAGVGLALVDTHCHLDIERYFPDCEATLARSAAVGVRDLVVAGVDREGWSRMVALSRKYPGVHAAPGLHPLYLVRHRPEDLALLVALAEGERLAAIGEVGLDYQEKDTDRAGQQLLFEAQIDIAAKFGLPLLLHARKSHDQVLATLRRKRFRHGGIVHAFNGSQQQAMHFIGMGFVVGVCGTITYDRSRKIRRVAAELPLEALVLETDAPDIPPSSHWGEMNQPEYLPDVLASLVALRQEGREMIARQTTCNAKRVLNLS